MFDFLTMEQSLGMSLDNYSYAEAAQMFAEHGREQWQHTAAQIAHMVSLFSDSKKGKKYTPVDFNPWEKGGQKRGIKLTRENLQMLKVLTNGQSG